MIQLQDRFGEMITERFRMIEEAVTLDHCDHRQSGDGGHRVAAKGAAMAARTEQPRGGSGRNAGANRKPIAQALGDGHDVGRKTFVDMDKPAATAAHPGLHLIHPQQGALLIADLPRLREITVGRHHHTVLALDRFEDDCGYRLVDHRG